MRWYSVALSGLVILLLSAAPASAEIFKWTDSAGRVHFTQDLNQVPPEYRVAAKESLHRKASAAIQIYSAPRPASPAPRTSRSVRKPAGGGGEHTYRIAVQKAGTALRVNVRLNDSVTAPFIIDTGASYLALPQQVADQLQLDTRGARTAIFGTANGTIEAPLIMLDSVQLGGARATKVQAAILEGVNIGLLGLSFFNHFTYSVDTARGVVTLTENDLEETGLIRGGRSEAQWRTAYVGLEARMAGVEQRRRDTPSSRSRKLASLKEELEELDRQLDVLDDEADAAHVPFRWRE